MQKVLFWRQMIKPKKVQKKKQEGHQLNLKVGAKKNKKNVKHGTLFWLICLLDIHFGVYTRGD